MDLGPKLASVHRGLGKYILETCITRIDAASQSIDDDILILKSWKGAPLRYRGRLVAVVHYRKPLSIQLKKRFKINELGAKFAEDLEEVPKLNKSNICDVLYFFAFDRDLTALIDSDIKSISGKYQETVKQQLDILKGEVIDFIQDNCTKSRNLIGKLKEAKIDTLWRGVGAYFRRFFNNCYQFVERHMNKIGTDLTKLHNVYKYIHLVLMDGKDTISSIFYEVHKRRTPTRSGITTEFGLELGVVVLHQVMVRMT